MACAFARGDLGVELEPQEVPPLPGSAACDQFKDAPDFGEHVQTQFIRALATVDEKMVILLDIDQLIRADDMMATTTH